MSEQVMYDKYAYLASTLIELSITWDSFLVHQFYSTKTLIRTYRTTIYFMYHVLEKSIN